MNDTDENWKDTTSQAKNGKLYHDYQKAHREKIRDEAFKILGNECLRCGEKDKIVLTIDHIEPCGKERKLTVGLYYEIIRQPEKAQKTYQLLCRNCNWKKMIENNEREPERAFAYESELVQTNYRVSMLERKIEKQTITTQSNQKYPTEKQLEDIIEPVMDSLLTAKGMLDVAAIRMYLREREGLGITIWKGYNLKRNLELRFPEKFGQ